MYQGVVGLVAFIYLYLANQITGRQLVAEIDRLVSGDFINGLSDECMDDFDDLHENMTLCVWDKHTYDESPELYINEDELREYVGLFINKWGSILAGLICQK